MLYGMMSRLDPKNCYVGGDDPRRGMSNFGETMCPDKPNTHNNCDLNWYMQQHTTGADAWLQALDKSIFSHEVRVGIVGLNTAGKSDIYDCLVFIYWSNDRLSRIVRKD